MATGATSTSVVIGTDSLPAHSKIELRETECPTLLLETDQERNSPPKPPDGGLWGWIQCLTGFCVFFNTFGLLNSFGENGSAVKYATLTSCKAHSKRITSESLFENHPRAKSHGLAQFSRALSLSARHMLALSLTGAMSNHWFGQAV
jgi:hypothetical protein